MESKQSSSLDLRKEVSLRLGDSFGALHLEAKDTILPGGRLSRILTLAIDIALDGSRILRYHHDKEAYRVD